MDGSHGPVVIVLGAARSGTKLLRDLLSASAHAAATPYDVPYVWRYGNLNHPDDALPASAYSDRIGRFIRSELRRLAGLVAGDDTTALIEKTVGNTVRVPFVRKVYPDAHFVHLVRDGRAVVESSRRQWEAPPEMGRLMDKLKGMSFRNLGYVVWFGWNFVKGKLAGRGGGAVWGPRYRGVEADAKAHDLLEVCARQWAESVRGPLDALADLPAGRVHTIRYEDLVASPDALVALGRALGLGDGDALQAAWRDKVTSENLNKWRDKLTLDEQARLTEAIAPELRALGYLTEQAA